MEAAAFVLPQLHETNKHATGHKEAGERLRLKQSLVFGSHKKKKKAQRLRTLQVPPARDLPGAPSAARPRRRSLLGGFFSPVFATEINKFTVCICFGFRRAAAA